MLLAPVSALVGAGLASGRLDSAGRVSAAILAAQLSARASRRRRRACEPKTAPSLAQRTPSHPAREKSDSTCWPKKVPLTVAFCGPATIIGHMMPRGIGANGFLAASSSRQAALASGSVPPAGSQRSVHRFGVAPGVGVTTTVSETLAAGAAVPGAPSSRRWHCRRRPP